MPTITARRIIERASILMQDTTNVRWPQDELLKWLNDGQREVVVYRPSAFAKTSVVALAAGTKQTLPADGTALLGVVRNMAADGVTPGTAIRPVTREILDAQIPDWHTMASVASVKHYIYHPANTQTYWVYPPSNGTGKAEIVYAAVPVDVTIDQVISVDDLYMSALLNYIMFRAYSKDAEYASNAQLATAYYQAFVGQLTGKADGENGIVGKV